MAKAIAPYDAATFKKKIKEVWSPKTVKSLIKMAAVADWCPANCKVFASASVSEKS
jgi:hypothetical protein